MKAIYGKLRIDQRYTLIGEDYNGKYSNDDDIDLCGETCENCGKYITNIAIVKGCIDGKIYRIGLDCASTLTGIEPDKIAQAKKILKQRAKLHKEINTIIKTALVSIKTNVAYLYTYNVTSWSVGCRWHVNYNVYKDSINNGKINVIFSSEV